MKKSLASITVGLLLASACGGDSSKQTSRPSGSSEPRSQGSIPTDLIRTAALSKPESCDGLLELLQKNALAQVGPFGLGGGGGYYGPMADMKMASTSSDMAFTGGEVESAPVRGEQSFSSTNTQVAGIDELDSVKTDGTTAWVLQDNTLRAVTLGESPTIAASRTFDNYGVQLLLVDGQLIVFSASYAESEEPQRSSQKEIPQPTREKVVVEVIDRESLDTKSKLELEGSLVDARAIGNSLRLVASQYGPSLSFIQPEDSNNLASLTEADAKNREVIKKSTLKDWIPETWLKGVREEACRNFGLPAEFSGFGQIAIAGIQLDGDALSLSSIAGISADAGSVYANNEHLYVATTRWVPSVMDAAIERRVVDNQSTELHRFDIADVANTKYEGSGSVRGSLLNSYSMDEYKDVLRIATTTQRWSDDGQNDSESQVVILGLQGSELLPLGEVSGLGKGETIQSVRFIEDRGYVVTFRRTDPLYVLNLTDPKSPSVTGELKVSGYSEYLHPVGEHRLLGVGPEADENGSVTGYQASLFDTSDPANPKQLSRVALGDRSSSGQLQYDPHAFLYWEKGQFAVLPVSGNEYSVCPSNTECFAPSFTTAAVVLGLGDELNIRAQVSNPDSNSDYYQSGITRSLVAGDGLYTISQDGILRSSMTDFAPGAFLAFPSSFPEGGPGVPIPIEDGPGGAVSSEIAE